MNESKPLTTRQRLRKYGFFTPQGIAEAMDLAQTLPSPQNVDVRRALGHDVGYGLRRAQIDIPEGVAYVAYKLAKARGISRSRLYREIVTYYLLAVDEATVNGVPALYQDFAKPEGIAVLAQAFREAFPALADTPVDAVVERVVAEREAVLDANRRAKNEWVPRPAEPPFVPEPLAPHEHEELENW